MNDTKGTDPQQAQRIGKKAVFYGRIAPALGATIKRTGLSVLFQRIKTYRPTKKHVAIVASAVILVGLVVSGIVLYQQKRQADERAAADAEVARQARQNADAQVCYRRKMQEKAAMLGKITYDQLYDGNSCLTEQK